MNMQLGGSLTFAWILGVGFWGGLTVAHRRSLS